MIRRIRAVAIAAIFATIATAGISAQKVTIMVGGIEKIIYLPAMLTERLGYFKDQGLDVTLITEPAGVDAENEMLAGKVDGVVGFYDHTIDLQSKGKTVVSVVQFSRAPGEVVLVDSRKADSIKSAADFKGKTMGVTGLGSSTNFLMQYLAVSHGVPVSQTSSLAVGAGNTFIAAMKQGQIDVGMTTEPTISRMLKTGDAKLLIDLRSPETTATGLGGLYPAACLYMQGSYIDKNRATVQKLANALVKTLQFISSHSAAEIAAQMPKDYYVGDPDLYINALATGKIMFTPDGVMPESGPPTVLKVLSTFDKTVMGKTIDLSKTYTTEFVKAAK
jgi:NitT/TauT family transport system substrate-binding protein